MPLRDQPYLPLYVQDFLTDEKLMECSAATTGIYIRLMCIMHKSDEYGTILLKQKDKQASKQVENFALKLARYMPYSVAEISAGISELLSEEVLKVEGDKLIQKRMVRDNEISNIRAVAGKKGGEKTQEIAKAKFKANSEYEYDIDNDIDNDIDIRESEEREKERKELNIPFGVFWGIYDKKTGRIKSQQKWLRLTDQERAECMKMLPAYIAATPHKEYRKDPATYLHNKSWEDEIITHNGKPVNGNKPKSEARREYEEKLLSGE